MTRLERRYAAFDGLNLTWESLEGIAKHNGPLTDRQGRGIGRYAAGLPHAIATYSAFQDLELWSHAGPEAQVAAISDDIAYDVHDIDDGLRAGLFSLDDLADLPVVGEALREVRTRWVGIDRNRTAHEVMRRVITRFIEDVVQESEARAETEDLRDVAAVRRLGRPIVGFSARMRRDETAIKGFLMPRMYRHRRVEAVMQDAQGVIRDLFGHFVAHPQDMGQGWAQDLDPADTPRLTRRVADYIAGMTDRYALDQHARFFDLTPDLR